MALPQAENDWSVHKENKDPLGTNIKVYAGAKFSIVVTENDAIVVVVSDMN